MKKLILVIVVVVINLSLFSCTQDNVADTDTLYETQATEGQSDEKKENNDPDS